MGNVTQSVRKTTTTRSSRSSLVGLGIRGRAVASHRRLHYALLRHLTMRHYGFLTTVASVEQAHATVIEMLSSQMSADELNRHVIADRLMQRAIVEALCGHSWVLSWPGGVG